MAKSTQTILRESAEIAALATAYIATGSNEQDAYNTARYVITGEGAPSAALPQSPTSPILTYIIIGAGVIMLYEIMKGRS